MLFSSCWKIRARYLLGRSWRRARGKESNNYTFKQNGYVDKIWLHRDCMWFDNLRKFFIVFNKLKLKPLSHYSYQNLRIFLNTSTDSITYKYEKWGPGFSSSQSWEFSEILSKSTISSLTTNIWIVQLLQDSITKCIFNIVNCNSAKYTYHQISFFFIILIVNSSFYFYFCCTRISNSWWYWN